MRDDNWQAVTRKGQFTFHPEATAASVTLPGGRGSAAARDWPRFVCECEAALRDDCLQRLADELGVSTESLRRLRIGWSREHTAFTFPMYCATGAVLGVRLRGRNGSKWSVRGGREGLFTPRTRDELPHESKSRDEDDRLVLCEGPTDCAALVDLGFRVVGRPSCSGGMRLIVELVQRLQPGELAILADGDQPGLRGAYNLASVLAVYVPCVRVTTPPDGVKDAREWKRAGATFAEMQRRIETADPLRLRIVVKGGQQ